MGGILSSSSSSSQSRTMASAKAKDLVASNPVVVFSKTYCPYCTRVKQLLSSLGVKSKVIELDEEGYVGCTCPPEVRLGSSWINSAGKTSGRNLNMAKW